MPRLRLLLAAVLLTAALSLGLHAALRRSGPAPGTTPTAASSPASTRSSPSASLPPTVRPASWAAPLARPGLSNLHRVSPTLYRGAQPTAEGFRSLRELGIKTVVNLRSFHSDRDELKEAGVTGIEYVNIDEKPWHAEDEDAASFLKVVTDPEKQPVFVHCQHGSDRTGTMCAVYRIVVQGWSKEEALRELTQGGFGYHAVWVNLPRYIRNLDVEGLRRAAGLAATSTSAPPTAPAPSAPKASPTAKPPASRPAVSPAAPEAEVPLPPTASAAPEPSPIAVTPLATPAAP